MKISLILFAIFALVAHATATVYETPRLPAPSERNPLMSVLFGRDDNESHIRHKRFTCDLLSFSADGVSGFNHAACAAKCLAQRHWGGHCDGPECKCVSKKW